MYDPVALAEARAYYSRGPWANDISTGRLLAIIGLSDSSREHLAADLEQAANAYRENADDYPVLCNYDFATKLFAECPRGGYMAPTIPYQVVSTHDVNLVPDMKFDQVFVFQDSEGVEKIYDRFAQKMFDDLDAFRQELSQLETDQCLVLSPCSWRPSFYRARLSN
jgi:hypothetical protein